MRTRCLLLATVASSLLLAGTAKGAPITIGSPLTASFHSESLVEATLANTQLSEAGAQLTSPVNGAIVRWRVADAAGPWKLRVLRPLGGGSYLGTSTSASVAPASLGTEVFATDLPIQVGETIGLDSGPASKIGTAAGAGTLIGWIPVLAGNESRSFSAEEPSQLAFNADVQPQPTVTAISPASGSLGGGTAVTVTGTDFASVSSVHFGSATATSFTVGSEGSLTATAPAAATLGSVDVTVTTVAGTSPLTTADRFEYVACVVPKLAGLKLKAAKKKLKKARCGLGKVTKLGGATAQSGRVARQAPKPGKTLAPGAKVKLTLR